MQFMPTLNFKKNPIVQIVPYIYSEKSKKWLILPLDYDGNENIVEIDDLSYSADLPPSDDENNQTDDDDDDNKNVNENNIETEDNNNDEEKKQEHTDNKSPEIIVMSFNVWFGIYKFAERQQKLVEIMQEIKPDIFCFQEVTQDWVNNIVNIPFIQKNYALSDIPSNLSTIIPYGVFIGVNIHKFFILDLKICQLESWMARKLLSTKIMLKNTGDIFWINTVHLESKNNSDVRIIQLQTIFDQYMVEMKQLNETSTAMLMGDFNFRDNMDNKYLDLVLEFKENDYLKENEFMMDCWKQYAKERNIEIKNGWTRRVNYRYDRIVMNKSSKWKVTDFKILGDAENKMPSDHKGVVVYLK